MRSGRIARAARWCGEALSLLVIAALTLLSLEQEAHAYLDPGSLNFIVQAIVGAILGAAIFIKLQWKRVKAATIRIFVRNGDEEKG
jgi:hypothetical protein